MTKSWTPPTREEILDALRTADSPLTPSELGERLGVPPRHADALEQRILAMEREGQLLPNRKGVLLLASKLDLVAGRITGHRDGFGFLVPDAGGPDLFLPPREMQKAMHGDRALVKRTGLDNRGKPEGAIVEITERAHRQLVGRVVIERGVTVVVPEDQRIKHDILIAPGDAGRAQPGQVVTVEIVQPPNGHSPPMGRVVEVLGAIDDPGMEIEIAVRKFDVPHQFSEEALALAAKLPAQVRPADYKRRIDLRDVPLVTIDGEDARDFDDAVYCEPLETSGRRAGGWRLLVAIADVAHYVEDGSALDTDALQRSTSVYFPRRVIPMLPEKLSNGLCSLNPAVDRLVLVADMVITARGQVKAYQFYEAVMHSAARLTYDEVWAVLSGRDPAAARARAPLVPHLQNLYDLYRALVKARGVRGAMDFETTETKIVCDIAGRIERIVPRTRNDAHKLIEECMLAANTCAADFVSRSRHPALYRIHEGPTPERLSLLREFLQGVGLSLGGGDDPTPADYAVLAQQIAPRDDAALLQTMLLRSMQQAIYSPYNVGHFGLSYEAYAHFTSPIRRYPDLLTHRVIKSLLQSRRYAPPVPSAEAIASTPPPRGRRGGPPKPSAKATARAEDRAEARTRMSVAQREELDRWQTLGLMCSANERRADDASRDVEAWLKCQYMRERVGEQFRGRVTGVATFGLFVTLNELFVEGMVHVSELGSEYFQYIEAAHELRGERTGKRFRLTDEIDVQVSRVDLEARRIEFRMVKADGVRPDARGPRVPTAAELGPAPAERGGRKAAPAKSEQVAQVRTERQAAKRRGGKPEQRGPKRKRR
ncbi:MAG: ribonuclease R [Burkholderiales bacterium]|nr:MAG: ribonuclease R [Burkholderiales bacterium]